jgi:hypothetical protein
MSIVNKKQEINALSICGVIRGYCDGLSSRLPCGKAPL